MTDLEPDTEVWHVPYENTNGRNLKVHSREGCPQLLKADSVIGPVVFGELERDWGLCDMCGGNVKHNEKGYKLYSKVASEEFSPEEGQSIAEYKEEIGL